MDRKTEFLRPDRKLVDEVADWLCGMGAYAGRGRMRETLEGARTLDHVMVVVPTAQSGRSLRLAVARRFEGRGVIPPRVVQPMQLVRCADDTLREATACEIAAAFQQYAKAFREDLLKLDCLVRPEEYEDLTARFALLDQLEDIWRILAGRGLLMGEVAALAQEKLAAEFGDELRRWQQLGKLESGFFGYLHEQGLAYPTERIHEAKEHAAIVDAAVEEIVIPSLADPIRVFGEVLAQQERAGKQLTVLLHADRADAGRFNEWGMPMTSSWTGASRPVLEQLTDDDIVCARDTSALARVVAKDFPGVKSGAALPALGLCDDGLYNGIAAAFLNHKYVVHNPVRHRLVQSSLGGLIVNLMALYGAEELPWKEFVAFFRSDDVLTALGLFGRSREKVLAGLDVAQNAYIPTVLPKGVEFPECAVGRGKGEERFAAFCEQARKAEQVIREARENASLVVFLREMLRWTFANARIPQGVDGKEFQAAADAARDLLNGLEGEFVSKLPMTATEFTALARRELDAAVYSLEPDSVDAIRTEGWLELAWSSAERIALVGFHEGKVPDSVVGHPFLPDSLRQHLGLVANVDRLARDSWLMQELLASHAPHSVRAYVARATDMGDIVRPSRLLYLCADGALAKRVGGLFGEIPEDPIDARRLVELKLRLPDVVEPPDHYSPSALDTYVKCPFTYLLKNGLRMKPYEDKQELGADDFGTLAHEALKAYADRQIARGDDQLQDAGEIRRLFTEEICPAIRARYGRMTLNIDLQLRALEGRLSLFAAKQAEWAKQGWRIRMAEKEVPKDLEMPGLGFRIHGFIDRVDENISANDAGATRWCVIDYKTWDEKLIAKHVYSPTRATAKSAAHLEMAERMGYPKVKVGKTAESRILSVQLPIYGMCLHALRPEIGFDEIDYRYFVLGSNEGECEIEGLDSKCAEEMVSASIQTAKRAVELIGKNIFWPPGPNDEWTWDLKGLFVTDPQTDLADTEWVKEQERRLEGCHG